MMIDILLDDKKAQDYGLLITVRPDIPTPELKVKPIEVQGKDGTWTEVDAYEDIEIECEFNMRGQGNIKPALRQIRAYFTNKKELSFNDDPGFYYKIKSIKMDDVQNELKIYGLFSVTFVCDPFQYEKDTPRQVVTNGGSITNTGTYKSLPLIKIAGTGDGTLLVNGKPLKTVKQTDTIVYDSELGFAYDALYKYNRNQNIRGEPPVLEVGKNTISWSGGITSVEIIGRWRYL